MTVQPRISLADDSTLLREGLVRLLQDAGFEVVGSYGDARALIDGLSADSPDLVMLDLRMPPTFTDEGLAAARELRSTDPRLPILLLSQYVEGVYAQEFFSDGGGGLGYLLKDRVLSLGELTDCLHRLLAGGTVLDPEIVSALVSARRNPLAELTEAERDVLQDMARGLTNAEIADSRVVALGTVEKQISSIFDKLGLAHSDGGHRRVLAVLTWLRNGR